MAGEHSGLEIGSLAGANPASTNPTFDPATQKFIDANFGSSAAWYNDPEIGPILKAASALGLQGQRYQDYVKTHKVDSTGAIIVVPPEQSWFGTHGATVRTTIAQKKNDIGAYNDGVAAYLRDNVMPIYQGMGVKLDQAALQKIAEDGYTNDWQSSSAIKSAISSQYHYDPKTADTGLISKTEASFASTAADYGITLPTDPAQMEAFIKGAIGPNGTEQDFTDWAKQQAIHAYPFLADALTRGSTVKGYLGNYATNIANVLDIPVDSISWADPKWQSLVNPVGATKLPNLNEVLTSIKLDPKYGYDNTVAAKNDAYDMAAKIKATFGFGA